MGAAQTVRSTQLTGIFQMFDADAVAAWRKSRSLRDARRTSYAFAGLSEEQLFQAGVPRPLIPAVKAATSDDALEALSAYLPPDCRGTCCTESRRACPWTRRLRRCWGWVLRLRRNRSWTAREISQLSMPVRLTIWCLSRAKRI